MNRTGHLPLRPRHRFARPFAPRVAPRLWLGLPLLSALVLFHGTQALGQLNDAAKKNPNPDAAAIQQWVDNAAKNLTNDDPEKQAKGRDDLSAGVVLSDAAAQASPQYLDAYAAAVAKALDPLTSHEDMRVRLNAAIANARVADRAGNTRLADVTVKFINDKTSAVALWGVKAARSMLPAALAQGANHPIVAAMVNAVQRFMVGPIITEVYDALALDVFRKPPPANVIKASVPQMLRVYRMRVDAYAAAVPPDPAQDNTAAEFLSYAPVWQQMSAAQHTETVQAMCDLIGLVGQYAQLMEGEERQPLLPVFKRTGAALQVIGDTVKNGPISNAAKEVQRVSSGMDGTEIVQRTTALTDALQKGFQGLKAPPKLQEPPAEGEAGGASPAPGAPGAPGTPGAPGATPPAANGKAPPAGGAAQPKSAAPASETDSAQTASDTTKAAPARAPAPPPNTGNEPAPAPAPSRPAR
jgi:hypothetical protein